jgi:hypothetical protein
MNTKEIEKHLEKMVEIFGSLPDPIHQPKKFKYMLELYKFLYI